MKRHPKEEIQLSVANEILGDKRRTAYEAMRLAKNDRSTEIQIIDGLEQTQQTFVSQIKNSIKTEPESFLVSELHAR